MFRNKKLESNPRESGIGPPNIPKGWSAIEFPSKFSSIIKEKNTHH